MKFITLALLWSFCTFAQEVVPRKAEDDLTFLTPSKESLRSRKLSMISSLNWRRVVRPFKV